MNAKEFVLEIIHCAIDNDVISKEDLLQELGNNDSVIGTAVRNQSDKEEIVNYLNSIESVSSNNFGYWCRRNKMKCKAKKTLDLCLSRGKFLYRQEYKNRLYYVRNSETPLVEVSDIVL